MVASRVKHWSELGRTFGFGNLAAFARARLERRPVEFPMTAALAAAPFVLRAGTSDIQVYMQVFVHKEYDFPCQSDVQTIVDGGANVGLTSLFFAQRFPEARIIAIEPEASNVAQLRRNVAGVARISPIRAALAAADGSVDLVDTGDGHWGFRTWSGDGSDRADIVESVPAFSVPSLMRTHGLESIDILKIDIEGAEKEILDSCDDWICQIGVLIVELHERFRIGCQRGFDHATVGFDREWVQGELSCAARSSRLPAEFGTAVVRQSFERQCPMAVAAPSAQSHRTPAARRPGFPVRALRG